MMIKFIKFSTFLIFIFCCICAYATEKKVYIINLNEEVNSSSWRYLKSGIENASINKFDAVIIHLNTYGGTLQHADSMRTKILSSPIPVYAFVDNNAASAGALIAIACKKIYMREGASIGASTVVDEDAQALPDKYQSYMRSMMRATAESHGKIMAGDSLRKWVRNPVIAEAMVDPRIVVPEIGDDSSKVVTLTAHEALKCGFNDGMASSINEVCSKYLGYEHCKFDTFHPTWVDWLMGFLTNPFVQGVLIMLVIGGIFFEMQAPGMGFPSLVALTAGVLYFLPLYLEGYAAPWEIIIFVVGLILIFAEIFVIPSFGIVGISGIILIFVSLLFAMLDNVFFNFELTKGGDIVMALFIVSISIFLGLIIVLYISHKIGSKGVMSQSALQLEQKIEDGYVGVPTDMLQYVGQVGVAVSVLRPAGKVKIDGKLLDAVSISDFIEPDVAIKVVKYENTQLYVARIDD